MKQRTNQNTLFSSRTLLTTTHRRIYWWIRAFIGIFVELNCFCSQAVILSALSHNQCLSFRSAPFLRLIVFNLMHVLSCLGRSISTPSSLNWSECGNDVTPRTTANTTRCSKQQQRPKESNISIVLSVPTTQWLHMHSISLLQSIYFIPSHHRIRVPAAIIVIIFDDYQQFFVHIFTISNALTTIRTEYNNVRDVRSGIPVYHHIRSNKFANLFHPLMFSVLRSLTMANAVRTIMIVVGKRCSRGMRICMRECLRRRWTYSVVA